MITELGIGNFKAFGEIQRVPIKPLTLIFGANSSGKSSIIHGLLLAHHGMETGDYDAHQTKLAGEMVDLGGFRNYVHKHDLSRAVTLCLETDIDRKVLKQLDGHLEERLPFFKLPQSGLLSRFSLSLTLAGPEPTLARAEVLLNQLPVLAFARRASGRFQAQTTVGSESYFPLVWRGIMEARHIEGATIRTVGPDPFSPEELAATDRKTEETVEGIRQQYASGQLPAAGDLAQFKEVFAQVIAEDEFSFDKGVLRDPGQESLRRWPVGREQLAEGGYSLVGIFGEVETWDAPARPPQWAEAQAVRYNFSALAEFCTSRIADVLGRISYLGPMRCVPSRYASVEGAMDARALASGGAAWDEMRRNPGVLGTVNRWLGAERLRLPYVLKSLPFLGADRLRIALRGSEASAELLVEKLAESPDSRVLVFEDANAGTTVSHRDIGFGVSQVLPVLVNAAAMRERLIAIEQPELHLHPAQQAELGDVFIESALGERKNTFLLETHSEHLILRVMRRIRETHEGKLPDGATPVTPKDVSVLFVEPNGAGRIVREMPLNKRGELVKSWPGGFFEEGYRELFS